MAAQTIFFNYNLRKKRVRYKTPTYRKSDKILQNILSYKDNQPHIFRYKTLHDIYEEIAFIVLKGQLRLPIGDFRLIQDGLIINFETDYGLYKFNYQAELEGTQLLPVGQRVRIHIAFLRLLKKGYKVKTAIKIMKKAGNL